MMEATIEIKTAELRIQHKRERDYSPRELTAIKRTRRMKEKTRKHTRERKKKGAKGKRDRTQSDEREKKKKKRKKGTQRDT